MTSEPNSEPLALAGQIVITWPKKLEGCVLSPVGISIHDAETGDPIVTFMDMNLSFAFGGDLTRSNMLLAEMTMLCDEDGQPLIARSKQEALVERYGPDGELLTAKFVFAVAEMRIAP